MLTRLGIQSPVAPQSPGVVLDEHIARLRQRQRTPHDGEAA
jgi:hypothetical protein